MIFTFVGRLKIFFGRKKNIEKRLFFAKFWQLIFRKENALNGLIMKEADLLCYFYFKTI